MICVTLLYLPLKATASRLCSSFIIRSPVTDWRRHAEGWLGASLGSCACVHEQALDLYLAQRPAPQPIVLVDSRARAAEEALAFNARVAASSSAAALDPRLVSIDNAGLTKILADLAASRSLRTWANWIAQLGEDTVFVSLRPPAPPASSAAQAPVSAAAGAAYSSSIAAPSAGAGTGPSASAAAGAASFSSIAAPSAGAGTGPSAASGAVSPLAGGSNPPLLRYFSVLFRTKRGALRCTQCRLRCDVGTLQHPRCAHGQFSRSEGGGAALGPPAVREVHLVCGDCPAPPVVPAQAYQLHATCLSRRSESVVRGVLQARIARDEQHHTHGPQYPTELDPSTTCSCGDVGAPLCACDGERGPTRLGCGSDSAKHEWGPPMRVGDAKLYTATTVLHCTMMKRVCARGGCGAELLYDGREHGLFAMSASVVYDIAFLSAMGHLVYAAGATYSAVAGVQSALYEEGGASSARLSRGAIGEAFQAFLSLTVQLPEEGGCPNPNCHCEAIVVDATMTGLLAQNGVNARIARPTAEHHVKHGLEWHSQSFLFGADALQSLVLKWVIGGLPAGSAARPSGGKHAGITEAERIRLVSELRREQLEAGRGSSVRQTERLVRLNALDCLLSPLLAISPRVCPAVYAPTLYSLFAKSVVPTLNGDIAQNALHFRTAAEVAAVAVVEPAAALGHAAADSLSAAAAAPGVVGGEAAGVLSAGIARQDMDWWEKSFPLFTALLRGAGKMSAGGQLHFPSSMTGRGKVLDVLARMAEFVVSQKWRTQAPSAGSARARAASPAPIRPPAVSSLALLPSGIGMPAAPRAAAPPLSASFALSVSELLSHALTHGSAASGGRGLLPSQAQHVQPVQQQPAQVQPAQQQPAQVQPAQVQHVQQLPAQVQPGTQLLSQRSIPAGSAAEPPASLLPLRRPRPPESSDGGPPRSRSRGASSTATGNSAAPLSGGDDDDAVGDSSSGSNANMQSASSVVAGNRLGGGPDAPLIGASTSALAVDVRGGSGGRGGAGAAAVVAAAASARAAAAAAAAAAATAAAAEEACERERVECEAFVDDPAAVTRVDWRLGQYFVPSLLRYRCMESVYAADARIASASYKPDPGLDGMCEKQYPTKRSHTPGILSGYCMHGFMLFHTFLQDAESPVGLFRVLYERFDVAPRIVVYDNACHLHRACLSREPHFFSNTFFVVDRLHWGNHKNCSPGYSCNIYRDTPLIVGINSEVAEQAHSQIKRIATQLGFMTLPNALRYLHFFFGRLNDNKLKRFLARCTNRKGVPLEGPALAAALISCRLSPEMLQMMKQRDARLNGGPDAAEIPAASDELLDSIVEEAEGLQLGELAADMEPEYVADVDAVVGEVASAAEALAAMAVAV